MVKKKYRISRKKSQRTSSPFPLSQVFSSTFRFSISRSAPRLTSAEYCETCKTIVYLKRYVPVTRCTAYGAFTNELISLRLSPDNSDALSLYVQKHTTFDFLVCKPHLSGSQPILWTACLSLQLPSVFRQAVRECEATRNNTVRLVDSCLRPRTFSRGS